MRWTPSTGAKENGGSQDFERDIERRVQQEERNNKLRDQIQEEKVL